MNKKRYWLFCYDNYYPDGGLNDVVHRCNTIEELLEYAHSNWETEVDTVEYTRKVQRNKIKYLATRLEHIITVRSGYEFAEILDLDTGDEISFESLGFKIPRNERVLVSETLTAL